MPITIVFLAELFGFLSLLLDIFILAIAYLKLLQVEQGGTISRFSIYFAKNACYCN
jgi:hypothetical protein